MDGDRWHAKPDGEHADCPLIRQPIWYFYQWRAAWISGRQTKALQQVTDHAGVVGCTPPRRQPAFRIQRRRNHRYFVALPVQSTHALKKRPMVTQLGEPCYGPA